MTDENLATLIKQKNPEVCGYVYDKYAPAIYGTIIKNVTDINKANSILLVSFTKCLSKLPQESICSSMLFLQLYNTAMALVKKTLDDSTTGKQTS